MPESIESGTSYFTLPCKLMRLQVTMHTGKLYQEHNFQPICISNMQNKKIRGPHQDS